MLEWRDGCASNWDVRFQNLSGDFQISSPESQVDHVEVTPGGLVQIVYWLTVAVRSANTRATCSERCERSMESPRRAEADSPASRKAIFATSVGPTPRGQFGF